MTACSLRRRPFRAGRRCHCLCQNFLMELDRILQRAGCPAMSFPVVIIFLANKFIPISNDKAGQCSLEDQLGPYGDGDGLSTGMRGPWAGVPMPPRCCAPCGPGMPGSPASGSPPCAIPSTGSLPDGPITWPRYLSSRLPPSPRPSVRLAGTGDHPSQLQSCWVWRHQGQAIVDGVSPRRRVTTDLLPGRVAQAPAGAATCPPSPPPRPAGRPGSARRGAVDRNGRRLS